MQRVMACIPSRKKNTCEYAKESTILIVAVEGRTGMALHPKDAHGTQAQPAAVENVRIP
jgi:hypothetical protein